MAPSMVTSKWPLKRNKYFVFLYAHMSKSTYVADKEITCTYDILCLRGRRIAVQSARARVCVRLWWVEAGCGVQDCFVIGKVSGRHVHILLRYVSF